MKSVTDGQCGQQNALVGLASNFGTSNQRIAPSAGSSSMMPSLNRGEALANEFLKQKAQQHAPTSFNMSALVQNLPQSSSSTSLSNKWSQEFDRKHSGVASQWANQYGQQMSGRASASMEKAWQVSLPPTMQNMPQSSKSTDSGMWSAEFLDNFDTNATTNTKDTAANWANEFVQNIQGIPSEDLRDYHQASMNNFWDESMFDEELKEHQQAADQYNFQESNPYATSTNPLTEGDSLMNSGNIQEANLAYEAAAQRDPQNADAWCKLGLSHAENERDREAILAFKKCLEINGNNREALLGNAVSLANEGLENQALHSLEKWITAFQGGDPSTIQLQPSNFSSFLDTPAFERIEGMFLNAARQQQNLDANLQNAMSILYNLNRNYQRAIDSIKMAISARPEDARLWNRLGATLANSDRSAEAISAYREALQKYPTYVRARYNLGIACMQLSTYKEALQHFISALELQKGNNADSSIWATMRSSAIRLREAPDTLLHAVERRDLDGVRGALRSIPNY